MYKIVNISIKIKQCMLLCALITTTIACHSSWYDNFLPKTAHTGLLTLLGGAGLGGITQWTLSNFTDYSNRTQILLSLSAGFTTFVVSNIVWNNYNVKSDSKNISNPLHTLKKVVNSQQQQDNSSNSFRVLLSKNSDLQDLYKSLNGSRKIIATQVPNLKKIIDEIIKPQEELCNKDRSNKIRHLLVELNKINVPINELLEAQNTIRKQQTTIIKTFELQYNNDLSNFRTLISENFYNNNLPNPLDFNFNLPIDDNYQEIQQDMKDMLFGQYSIDFNAEIISIYELREEFDKKFQEQAEALYQEKLKEDEDISQDKDKDKENRAACIQRAYRDITWPNNKYSIQDIIKFAMQDYSECFS